MTKKLYVFRSLSNLGQMYEADGETEAHFPSGTEFYLAAAVDAEASDKSLHYADKPAKCPYCERPADSDGSIFHVSGCAGLETVELNRLQYDALVSRAADKPCESEAGS